MQHGGGEGICTKAPSSSTFPSLPSHPKPPPPPPPPPPRRLHSKIQTLPRLSGGGGGLRRSGGKGIRDVLHFHPPSSGRRERGGRFLLFFSLLPKRNGPSEKVWSGGEGGENQEDHRQGGREGGDHRSYLAAVEEEKKSARLACVCVSPLSLPPLSSSSMAFSPLPLSPDGRLFSVLSALSSSSSSSSCPAHGENECHAARRQENKRRGPREEHFRACHSRLRPRP